ncbi:BREX-2 system phosphatase PglZ [Thermomonospora amylolytica]|uniref:BREX-2 system phosphatase PglZ n=1 Tax=Thermomonospora amylolytica TaxID=1411117 RepID=UPI000E6C4385|nr:BREX-2 system phosphatase PglZ [Thermomonospora amylolytica]
MTTTTQTSAPEATQPVVEGELRRALRHNARRRERLGPGAGTEKVLVLRAAPEWRGPDRITVAIEDGRPVTARVRGCPTVLAVLDALSGRHERDEHLVLLTPCTKDELGESVLAQVIGNEIQHINRWDLVAEAFGARVLDPRLTAPERRWLAESLLDAQPTGWRRLTGPTLELETALRRLSAVRFGKDEDERLDAAALLEWSRDEVRVARFLALDEQERRGLITWLEQSVGPVASVVFRMLRHGHVHDAVPFGLVAAELYAPTARRQHAALQARGRAEERYFGGQAPSEQALKAFAEAAESLTLRWSQNGRAEEAGLICERAEQILVHELQAGSLAEDSKLLSAGLDARLGRLAKLIAQALPAPKPIDLGVIEAALTKLGEHRRTGDRAAEVNAAISAVRLTRWLVRNEPPAATVKEAATWYVRVGGWVDRALAELWNADTSRVPQARSAYAALYEAVRARRAGIDRGFAERLAAWEGTDTSTLLLAETLLDRVARPVAEKRAPLIIVLDGMSAGVAAQLAEEILATRAWTEVGRDADGREAALATLPSVTTYSRTSLLCGRLQAGGQSEEHAGFTALWGNRRSKLFHKGDLPGGAGAVLDDEVLAAIRDPGTVVGVVLNTIDDALRDGREGSAPTWRLADVTYLGELLAEAARVGRPVILTSDHGHVLDRGDDIHPANAKSARHRSGTPGEGELLFRGPRVLAPGGEVVMPWDERIRYLQRRAGYHGGASLAEMIIPVLVFVTTESDCPKGWHPYANPSLHEPSWWNTSASPAVAVPAPRTPVRASQRRAAPQDDALFSPEDAAQPKRSGGLGERIIAAPLYQAQRGFIRKPPPDDKVAALIDALAGAGGKLPVQAAAKVVGQPPFRMAGFLAQVGRLLNVDGYQVIGEIDGGRTVDLNEQRLKEQFLGA